MITPPYRVIPLSQGYVAIIDAKNYRRVNRYKWHVHFSRGKGKRKGEPYARATVKGEKVYLHRWLVGAAPGSHVDHRNWQTLDCREENIREITHTENLNNRRPKRKIKC